MYKIHIYKIKRLEIYLTNKLCYVAIFLIFYKFFIGQKKRCVQNLLDSSYILVRKTKKSCVTHFEIFISLLTDFLFALNIMFFKRIVVILIYMIRNVNYIQKLFIYIYNFSSLNISYIYVKNSFMPKILKCWFIYSFIINSV